MSRSLVAFIAGVTIVGLMVASMGPVAGLAYLVGLSSGPWWAWLLAMPVIYLVWLATFLRLSAAMIARMGRKHPKPRTLIMRPGMALASEDRAGMLTVGTCYRIYAVLLSVPFLSLFAQLPYLKTLIYRAYAPSVHMHDTSVVMGRVLDPDLTTIGEFAVIGGSSLLVAHSMAYRSNGERVYATAPIVVQERATIGGDALVGMGTTVCADAIVEPGSVVEPFTTIPAGEVWGGNPARFRRRRDDMTGVPSASSPVTAQHEPPTGQTPAPAGHRAEATDLLPLNEARALVIEALSIPPDDAAAHPDLSQCHQWDSLGQVAIAAALFDRYGVSLHPDAVFRLKTLEDVAAAARPAHRAQDLRLPPAPEPAEADRVAATDAYADIEMLPLLGASEATSVLTSLGASTAALTPLQINVAATFTAHALEPTLKVWGRAFGFDVRCHIAGYDQIVQSVLDPTGPFGTAGTVNVVLLRPDDLSSRGADEAEGQLAQIVEAIRHAVIQRPASQWLIGSMPPVVSSFCALEHAVIERLRFRWRGQFDNTPGVELFDFSGVVERAGVDNARSNQADAITRAGYAPRIHQELAIALIRSVRATRRSPAKVIALDCDNTLWGGVLGEVGPQGIQLASDGIGRCYQLFQQHLKRLQQRGLLLVIVSKNELADVRAVFEQHPGMVLRPDDIAMWKVNWNHKSENLRVLADDLNLGLDSFVFVDDDPAIRLEVKSRVPSVHVVPMPADPAVYVETLQRLWLFDGARATAVDAARTRMAQEEQRRHEDRDTAVSLETFLAQLDLHVDVSEASDQDIPRVAQLTQRTNQFNLSLKRRSVDEVAALAAAAPVLVVSARDRFGDYGQVGVCMLEPASGSNVCEIDTLLMSCRALGRGVEDAFLFGIATLAAEHGASRLVARFTEGPRNAQVKAFLARSGFSEREPNLWERSLHQLPPLPPHVGFRRRGERWANA